MDQASQMRRWWRGTFMAVLVLVVSAILLGLAWSFAGQTHGVVHGFLVGASILFAVVVAWYAVLVIVMVTVGTFGGRETRRRDPQR
jgi:uncharacterized membrane protein